jgi:hypothetical protein
MPVFIGYLVNSALCALKIGVFAFVFLISVECCNAQNGHAQGCLDTVPDCYVDKWQGVETTTYSFCVAGKVCTITVTYCYRLACGAYRDISIRTISFDPDCVGNLVSTSQLVDMAMTAAVRHRYYSGDQNYQNIPQCPSNNIDWRVVNAPCWTYVMVGDTQYAVPCIGTGFCFITYKVCWTTCPDEPCGDIGVPCIRAQRNSASGTGQCTSEGCFEICS